MGAKVNVKIMTTFKAVFGCSRTDVSGERVPIGRSGDCERSVAEQCPTVFV